MPFSVSETIGEAKLEGTGRKMHGAKDEGGRKVLVKALANREHADVRNGVNGGTFRTYPSM